MGVIPQDLLFVNRGLVGDVMAGGRLGHSNHRMIVFNSLRSKKKDLQNCCSGIPECRLFTCLGDWFTCEAGQNGRDFWEGWTIFEKEIFKVQEMCSKDWA